MVQIMGKEMTVRAAMGASRSRIAAEFLNESLLLGALGGLGGIGLAYAGLAFLRSLGPAELPRLADKQSSSGGRNYGGGGGTGPGRKYVHRVHRYELFYQWRVVKVNRENGLITVRNRHTKQVLELDPDYAPGYFRLGLLYYLTKRQEDALNAFQRTLDLDPQHSNALALMIGVVIVGCVPGAMASNVMTVLLRGDLGESVWTGRPVSAEIAARLAEAPCACVFVDEAQFLEADQVWQLARAVDDLGVPVNWGQISGARVIVEATLPEVNTDLSQGSHFFHNVLGFRVLYLSVHHDGPWPIDWEWLRGQVES